MATLDQLLFAVQTNALYAPILLRNTNNNTQIPILHNNTITLLAPHSITILPDSYATKYDMQIYVRIPTDTKILIKPSPEIAANHSVLFTNDVIDPSQYNNVQIFIKNLGDTPLFITQNNPYASLHVISSPIATIPITLHDVFNNSDIKEHLEEPSIIHDSLYQLNKYAKIFNPLTDELSDNEADEIKQKSKQLIINNSQLIRNKHLIDSAEVINTAVNQLINTLDTQIETLEIESQSLAKDIISKTFSANKTPPLMLINRVHSIFDDLQFKKELYLKNNSDLFTPYNRNSTNDSNHNTKQ